MSIIIKGMDMPKKGCWDCPLMDCEGGCLPLDKGISYKQKGRHPDCPLIEIVECQECKYCETYAVSNDTPIGRWCHRFSITKAVESDDFCSYGERRKDESNH